MMNAPASAAAPAPAPVAVLRVNADHPIWPHARAAMTDPAAIRLRLGADILIARAVCGFIDQQHQIAAGWTLPQLRAHFAAAVNALYLDGRLPPIVGAGS